MSASPESQELLLERSGGLAGLTLRARIPMRELTEEQRAAVDECLSRPPYTGPGQPDRFQYRLALGERDATVPEDGLPSALKPLLSRLELGG